jgi:ABC-type bacteriocin/lantibiotic exporter with double-glycine peptidase domain
MNNKFYLKITALVSIFFGIIFPLTMGVKDPTLLAVFFSLIWFIYAVSLFITTFLIEGRRSKKKLYEKDKNGSFPLRDIQELQALYEITIKKDNENQNKLRC